MADDDKQEVRDSEAPSEGADRGERSGTRYPYYNLEEAEKFARAVQESGGNEVLEDDLLKHLSVSRTTKSWIYKLSTAREFGLIERKGQKADARITLTDLGKRMLLPADENELSASKIAAFLTPPLYKNLFKRYAGAPVPQMKFLANALSREHKLVESVTEQAAIAFTDSAKFAGLVNSANVLCEPKAGGGVQPPPPAVEKSTPAGNTPEVPVPEGFIVHPFLLRKDPVLMVHIPLPHDLTKKDVKRLVKLLEAHVTDDDEEDV